MTRSGPLLRSRKIAKNKSGVQISLTPRQARWEFVGFAVRQIAAGETWTGRTGRDESCLVLLSGLAPDGGLYMPSACSALGWTCSATIRTPFTCRLDRRSR